MEVRCVFFVGQRRVEVRPAAEPRGLRGEEARVHVHRRDMGVRHMRNQADAGGGKAGILRARAVYRTCKLRCEIAAYGRDIHADLLEHLALHQPARTATGIGITLLLALPAVVLESGIAARLTLDTFELGANAVAQGFEPGAGGFGLASPVGHKQALAIVLCSRQ